MVAAARRGVRRHPQDRDRMQPRHDRRRRDDTSRIGKNRAGSAIRSTRRRQGRFVLEALRCLLSGSCRPVWCNRRLIAVLAVGREVWSIALAILSVGSREDRDTHRKRPGPSETMRSCQFPAARSHWARMGMRKLFLSSGPVPWICPVPLGQLLQGLDPGCRLRRRHIGASAPGTRYPAPSEHRSPFPVG